MQEKHPAYGESFTGKQINRKFFRTLAYHTIPPVEDECFSDKLMKTQKTFDIGSRTVHNIRVFLNEKLLLPGNNLAVPPNFLFLLRNRCTFVMPLLCVAARYCHKENKKKEDFFK